MKNYAAYNQISGEIQSMNSCNDYMLPAEGSYENGYLVIHTPDNLHKYYVDVSVMPHQLKNKTPHPLFINKTQIVADGNDLFIVSGIHNPSTVIWPDGKTDIITDGEVGFSVDQVGNYTIKLISMKHFNEEINIEAIPTA